MGRAMSEVVIVEGSEGVSIWLADCCIAGPGTGVVVGRWPARRYDVGRALREMDYAAAVRENEIRNLEAMLNEEEANDGGEQ